eukprot:jgi/Picre1/32180/NNA_007526.t1
MESRVVAYCVLLLLVLVLETRPAVGARRVRGRRLNQRKGNNSDVRGGNTAISIGSGYFCAVSTKLDVYCWGTEPETGESIVIPTKVPAGGTQFTSVSVGLRYLCAVAVDGTAYCKGKGFHGELGTGVAEDVREDLSVPVQGGLKFDQVTTGLYHACGVTVDDELYCWGDNEYGQLGTGDDASSAVPVKIGTGWSQISAGGDHTCGTKLDGTGYCWGLNDFHQVSPGAEYQYATPQKVKGAWRSLHSGYSYTLGVDSKGKGYGWGLAENIGGDSAVGGHLGDGGAMCLDLKTGKVTCEPSNGYAGYASFVKNPTPMKGDRRWKTLSPGKIPCGIEAKTKNLYCWGYTAGEGYAAGSPGTNVPMLVSKSGWNNVASGISGARCGIDDQGQAYCWGRNEYDCVDMCPLGDGNLQNSNVPAKVLSVDKWRSDSSDGGQNIAPAEQEAEVVEEDPLPVPAEEAETLPVAIEEAEALPSPVPIPVIVTAPEPSTVEDIPIQEIAPMPIEEDQGVSTTPETPTAGVAPVPTESNTPEPIVSLPESGTNMLRSITNVAVVLCLALNFV